MENLEYLSVEQAMADLAHAIRFMRANVPELENSKVILLGCSYAGTLVSYFRQLYPDLVDGVWAAGAALLLRLDYSGRCRDNKLHILHNNHLNLPQMDLSALANQFVESVEIDAMIALNMEVKNIFNIRRETLMFTLSCGP